ncbi:MAG TPA: UDP-N-acetylmuramate dehydrogenase [Candidatus Obscuribacterales bacterium]
MEQQDQVPLWRFTTLKIGGEARRLYLPTSVDELADIVEQLAERDEPWFVLGGGSNLLVSSKGYEGSVIRTTQITGVTRVETDVLEAGAGARLPHLARFAATLGLAGLEFSVGIPGTVGGGVIMNAGAHGSCMANVVESVTIYDSIERRIVTLEASQLGFQYRKCKLSPSTHVVLSARLKLIADRPEEIEARVRHNEEYRWRTQPLGWPNAGSTFKNPEPGRGAGLLLDQAGAKTLRQGQAAVSAVHANFVINMGGATSEEVAQLMRRMQNTVYEKFQISLEPEWKTLGTFSNEEQKVWAG